ncbi:MAG: hypothetical protein U9N61_07965 [Euryarchaeota archaeon]|nr:hypothetical protein [Euryarchaeota archaeon]
MNGTTKPKRFEIAAALLITALLIGVVVVAASGDDLQDIYLQELYRRYNVTENDILFAKNELPHYLNGTILDGDTRVVVTATGEPGDLKEGEDYDVVISTKEMHAVMGDAKKRYIGKYGVDPANPKLDEVGGILLPNEEVERLVKIGMIVPW